MIGTRQRSSLNRLARTSYPIEVRGADGRRVGVYQTLAELELFERGIHASVNARRCRPEVFELRAASGETAKWKSSDTAAWDRIQILSEDRRVIGDCRTLADVEAFKAQRRDDARAGRPDAQVFTFRALDADGRVRETTWSINAPAREL